MLWKVGRGEPCWRVAAVAAEACSYNVDKSEQLGDGGLDAVSVVNIEGSAGMGGSVDADVLIVGRGGKFYNLGILADSWNPGAFSVSNEGKVDAFSAADVVPGARGKELIISAHTDNYDDDPGDELSYDDHRAEWWICGVFSGQGACITLENEHSTASYKLKDESHDRGKRLSHSEWELSVAVVDGKVAISVDGGLKPKDLTAEQRACIGTFAPEELVNKPCVTVQTF